jgi:hypothetical protein
MKSFLRKLSLVFAAGCLGGLINSFAAWLAGSRGLTQALGVNLAPHLTLQWLYPRLVWGGIWGFIFLLPILTRSPIQRGLLLSLGPTLMQLFYFFPQHTAYGQMGMALGTLTPLAVLVLNAIWGLTASFWLWAAEDRRW